MVVPSIFVFKVYIDVATNKLLIVNMFNINK